ncbi:MAG TPA: CocE/NonD family hydrolase [Blastocatellia bacterium]|nr:CocE/NonD family hydrolase [Blastocatellia bacterium]
MRKKILLPLILVLAGLVALSPSAPGQRRAADPELVARRNALERELQSIAIVERKLMVPTRDGKRMATDVYRPKDTSKRYPAVFVRTPYNFNFWDVRNGAPSDMSDELEA